MNSLIKIDSDDAVNIYDEGRKLTRVGERNLCLFKVHILLYWSTDCSYSIQTPCCGQQQGPFNVKAMAGNVTWRDHQYIIHACFR